MSEDLTRRSSPDSSKPGWVQFDSSEDKSSSSGVSSARGSVNSAAVDDDGEVVSPGGASLAVTDIQVMDEQTLRKKSSASVPKETRANGTVSAVSATAGTSARKSSSTVDEMDNVHLGEDEVTGEQPSKFIRGRQFENGEIIVTLLPVNERFPWVTPARFRPELVPEELMAPVLTLTVEDYVQTMEKLITDMRFSLFNICYKRILVIWIVAAFTILLGLLFSGFQGVQLFACGVAWLILNAAAIFFCMWIKLKLNKQLEKCMASINSGLLKHNLILGLDDRGKISCHKVNLCFIYFEAQECIKRLESLLAEKPDETSGGQNGEVFNREAYLRDVENFEDVEVVVSGRNSVKIDRKAERAEKLFLHYVQRWSKDYIRRRLDWIVEDLYGRTEYASNTNPRHLRSAHCPCQYIEDYLRNKRQRESLNPCTFSANPCHWCD